MRKTTSTLIIGWAVTALTFMIGCGKDEAKRGNVAMSASCFYAQTNQYQGQYSYQNQYPNQYPNQYQNQYQNQYPNQYQNQYPYAAAPGSACAFNYGAQPGFSNFNAQRGYNYVSSGAAGLATGCLNSQGIAYSEQKGLGCADNLQMRTQVPALYELNTSTISFVPVPYEVALSRWYGNGGSGAGGFGYSNMGNLNGSRWGSSVMVYRACDAAADPCPSGQSCVVQPSYTGVGGTIGLCVYGG